MPRKKQQKFAELNNYLNVFQYDRDNIKKKLASLIKNKNVILELACGRGEYSNALAEQNPKNIYLGFDVQGERLWFGAKQSTTKKLNNVFFVRAPIEKISEYLPLKSVTEIWIVFPDPFPKDKHQSRRLTAPYFLKLYYKILKNKGVLHLKTDSQSLFEYSKQTLPQSEFAIKQVNENIILDSSDSPLNIQTAFENKHRQAGKSIKYLLAQKK